VLFNKYIVHSHLHVIQRSFVAVDVSDNGFAVSDCYEHRAF